ncbi:MAG: hypothetical protein ACI87O_001527 [Planctomycetota bacterium]|jgi:hypothetical protein
MPSNLQRQPLADGAQPFKLLRGGKPSRHAQLAKPIVVLLALATFFRLWTALGGSQGIVAEDTYTVLRQGRNLLQHGQYAFNVGVEGVSAPMTLFGLLLAPVQALLGRGTPWFLLTFNTVLWTCAILTLLRPMRPSIRPGIALLLCLAPAFVSGALHGTDAEWLGFLLALSYASISVGRTVQSIVWFSLAVLSSPATCLFAPVLLSVHGGRLGIRFGFRSLMKARNLAALVGPVLIWSWIVNSYSDHGVAGPWLHWMQNLSSPWVSLGDLWLGLPRYTLLAGTQNYPIVAQHTISVLMFALLAVTVRQNLKQGTASSRGWLCFYLLMVAFGTGVSGSALEPAASVLPAMAFIMALVPLLLPLVPRFHGTRILRACSLILVTLAMPIAFAAIGGARALSKDLQACASTIEAAQESEITDSVLTSQAGFFGFLYPATVLEAQEAMQPDQSFAQFALQADTDWVLLPQSALDQNQLAGGEPLWRNDYERSLWNAVYTPFDTQGTWHIFKRKEL